MAIEEKAKHREKCPCALFFNLDRKVQTGYYVLMEGRKMKIKDGFVLRRILDDAVVIANGDASKNFHGMIKLNDSGADVWEWISQGLSENEVAEKLAQKYEIDSEKALADTQKMIKKMTETGLLEV